MRHPLTVLALTLCLIANADAQSFGMPLDAFPERFNATADAAKFEIRAGPQQCSESIVRSCRLHAGGLAIVTSTGQDKQGLESIDLFLEKNSSISSNSIVILVVLVLLLESSSTARDRSKLFDSFFQPVTTFSVKTVRLGRTEFFAMTVPNIRVVISARRAN